MHRLATRMILGAWIVLISCSAGPLKDSGSQINWHRDYEIALSEAKLLDRPVLAYITARWCPASLRLEHSTFLDKRVVKLLRDSFVVVQLDADTCPELAKRLGVEKPPVSIVLSKDGRAQGRIEGYQPTETYLAELSKFIKPIDPIASINAVKKSSSWSKAPDEREPEKPTVPRDEIKLTSLAERQQSATDRAPLTTERGADPMLEGNCPVTMQERKKLVQGLPEFQLQHDGRTYRFAGAEELAKFKLDPARYVPVMCGRCVVSSVDEQFDTEGIARYAAIYRGRLYIFAGAEQRRRFQTDPKRYADCDTTVQAARQVDTNRD